MIFVAMLLAAAISLAAAAGYFSISGLSETYAASVVSIIIMGTCLEASKLILASFIHKFWTKINFILKGICCIMLVILMFITSYGVFGHLTAAYQQDSMPLTDISQKLDQDKTELARLVARKSQMDSQIAKLPDSYVRARTQLIKSFGEEYTNVPSRITALNTEISDLSSKQLSTQTKIGPIIYMAKVLGQDPDTTIFYFTFLITIVFDPLAVTLIFAYHIALKSHKEDKLEKENKIIPKLEPDPDLEGKSEEIPVTAIDITETSQELVPINESTEIEPKKKSVIDEMYEKLRQIKKPVD